MYKHTNGYTDTIETDYMPVEPFTRAAYLFEMLERRLLMAMVPIDATAGVPFNGLVATELHLPAYATSPQLINVLINGQWDYTPTAVKNSDGTYDLYTKLTPQRAGTEEAQIIFRNNNTGGWDLLESGMETVKANDFSDTAPNSYLYNQVPGTQFRGVLATFNTTPLTQSLDQYVANVDWFGKTKTGRLVQQANGSVAVYVDNAYLPVGNADSDVTVMIRRAGSPADAPPAGLAVVSVSVRELGIGSFVASMTSATDFSVALPPTNAYGDDGIGSFRPAAMQEGWPSTFAVKVIWSNHSEDVATTSGTVVRQPDGSYAVVGTRPSNIETDSGMIKITETVERPAVDGDPAETYTISYVGSFNFNPPPVLTDPQTPPGGGTSFHPDPGSPIILEPADPDSPTGGTLTGKSATGMLLASGEELPTSTPFASGERTNDSLITDVFSKSDDPLLSRESDDLTTLIR